MYSPTPLSNAERKTTIESILAKRRQLSQKTSTTAIDNVSTIGTQSLEQIPKTMDIEEKLGRIAVLNKMKLSVLQKQVKDSFEEERAFLKSVEERFRQITQTTQKLLHDIGENLAILEQEKEKVVGFTKHLEALHFECNHDFSQFQQKVDNELKSQHKINSLITKLETQCQKFKEEYSLLEKEIASVKEGSQNTEDSLVKIEEQNHFLKKSIIDLENLIEDVKEKHSTLRLLLVAGSIAAIAIGVLLIPPVGAAAAGGQIAGVAAGSEVSFGLIFCGGEAFFTIGGVAIGAGMLATLNAAEKKESDFFNRQQISQTKDEKAFFAQMAQQIGTNTLYTDEHLQAAKTLYYQQSITLKNSFVDTRLPQESTFKEKQIVSFSSSTSFTQTAKLFFLTTDSESLNPFDTPTIGNFEDFERDLFLEGASIHAGLSSVFKIPGFISGALCYKNAASYTHCRIMGDFKSGMKQSWKDGKQLVLKTKKKIQKSVCNFHPIAQSTCQNLEKTIVNYVVTPVSDWLVLREKQIQWRIVDNENRLGIPRETTQTFFDDAERNAVHLFFKGFGLLKNSKKFHKNIEIEIITDKNDLRGLQAKDVTANPINKRQQSLMVYGSDSRLVPTNKKIMLLPTTKKEFLHSFDPLNFYTGKNDFSEPATIFSQPNVLRLNYYQESNGITIVKPSPQKLFSSQNFTYSIGAKNAFTPLIRFLDGGKATFDFNEKLNLSEAYKLATVHTKKVVNNIFANILEEAQSEPLRQLIQVNCPTTPLFNSAKNAFAKLLPNVQINKIDTIHYRVEKYQTSIGDFAIKAGDAKDLNPELVALDFLQSLKVKHMKFPQAIAIGRDFLIKTFMPGKVMQDLMSEIGISYGTHRKELVEEMKMIAEHVGQAVAEFLNKGVEQGNKVCTKTALFWVDLFQADFAILQKELYAINTSFQLNNSVSLQNLIKDFLINPGPASYGIKDISLSQFSWCKEQKQFSCFDVEFFADTMNKQLQPIEPAQKEFWSFLDLFISDAQNLGVQEEETNLFKSAFEKSFSTNYVGNNSQAAHVFFGSYHQLQRIKDILDTEDVLTKQDKLLLENLVKKFNDQF